MAQLLNTPITLVRGGCHPGTPEVGGQVLDVGKPWGPGDFLRGCAELDFDV